MKTEDSKSAFECALIRDNIFHIKTSVGIAMNRSDLDVEKYGDLITGYDDWCGGLICVKNHLIK